MPSPDRDDDDDHGDELQFVLELEGPDRTAPRTSNANDLVSSDNHAADTDLKRCKTLDPSRTGDEKRVHKEKEFKK